MSFKNTLFFDSRMSLLGISLLILVSSKPIQDGVEERLSKLPTDLVLLENESQKYSYQQGLSIPKGLRFRRE